MKSKVTSIDCLPKPDFELARMNHKMDLTQVFAPRRDSYLNEFTLFIAHFNVIPNFIHEINIDCKKANTWFLKKYANEITNCYYDKRYFNNNKKAEFDDIFYFLYDDLIVDFDTNNSIVRFLFRKTEVSEVEKVISGIHKFGKAKSQPEIMLIINSNNSISKKALQITKPKLSIANNYNDDFQEVHQTILKRLSRKNDKGLILLHGKPGTGKTSYIRYLISTVKKSVVFLPPNMASAITNPDLISILINNPNSIFVIEDAENIVVDREQDGNSPVSVLLNISDGLLSDCLNIQIICSFNTDISKVDNALLRKGRLIAKYEFKELEADKAQALSNKLGFTTTFNSPALLTTIYNQEEKDFYPAKRSTVIGFRSNDI